MKRKYIIYGAGKRGKIYYDFIKYIKMDLTVVDLCNIKYNEITWISTKQVFGYEKVSYRSRSRQTRPNRSWMPSVRAAKLCRS